MASDASGNGGWWRRLRVAAMSHVAVLVALRLWIAADDFNNWDLIGLVNANAFEPLSLLARPELHFLRPFSFPTYNTGAESVLTLLIHRAMSRVSLYWSNTAVIAVYDAVFFAALASLVRKFCATERFAAVAWLLLATSPVLLTFPAILSFDMQAFATIAIALVACEWLLETRYVAGTGLLSLAFLSISQAYPLTFFLPLFVGTWTLARLSMLEPGLRGAMKRGFPVVVATLVLVAVVETFSDPSGPSYLQKAFGLFADPVANSGTSTDGIATRFAGFLRESAVTRTFAGTRIPGFGPVVLWCIGAAAVGLAARVAVFRDAALRRSLLPLAALVAFGYAPVLVGTSLKSQRTFFGDLFLVLFVALVLEQVFRRAPQRGRAVSLALFAGILAADAAYLGRLALEDHSRSHRPAFDYDANDGISRHDLDRTIRRMRRQVDEENAGLLIHYPCSAENTTDPPMFFGRFLRQFGDGWNRDDLLFSCRFCSVRYGCPFPDVAGEACAGSCCWVDPTIAVERRAALRGRPLYLWWYADARSAGTDEVRRRRILRHFEHTHRVRDFGSLAQDTQWHVWRLEPL